MATKKKAVKKAAAKKKAPAKKVAASGGLDARVAALEKRVKALEDLVGPGGTEVSRG